MKPFNPEDYGARPPPAGGVMVGSDNVIREGVSIDAACGHAPGKKGSCRSGRCVCSKLNTPW